MKKIRIIIILGILFLITGCDNWEKVYSEHKELFDAGFTCNYINETEEPTIKIHKMVIEGNSSGMYVSVNDKSLTQVLGPSIKSSLVYFDDINISFSNYKLNNFSEGVDATGVCQQKVSICNDGGGYNYLVPSGTAAGDIYSSCDSFVSSGSKVHKKPDTPDPNPDPDPVVKSECYLDNAKKCKKINFTSESGHLFYIIFGYSKYSDGSTGKYMVVSKNIDMSEADYVESNSDGIMSLTYRVNSVYSHEFRIMTPSIIFKEGKTFADDIVIREKNKDATNMGSEYLCDIGISGVTDPEIVSPTINIEKIHFCGEQRVLQVFKIIGIILFIVKILVPVIIIIFGTLDLVKAITSNSDKSNKDAIMALVRRFIIGVIIFLIPTILDITLSYVDGVKEITTDSGTTETVDSFSACTHCLFAPFDC